MKVGIPLFMLRPEQLVPVARRAEELGFESVWVAEHLVFPTVFVSRYPYAEVPPVNPRTKLLDPLLILAQVAAVTSTIRIGPTSTCCRCGTRSRPRAWASRSTCCRAAASASASARAGSPRSSPPRASTSRVAAR